MAEHPRHAVKFSGGTTPSTGLMAVVLLHRECRRLRVYGLGSAPRVRVRDHVPPLPPSPTQTFLSSRVDWVRDEHVEGSVRGPGHWTPANNNRSAKDAGTKCHIENHLDESDSDGQYKRLYLRAFSIHQTACRPPPNAA